MSRNDWLATTWLELDRVSRILIVHPSHHILTNQNETTRNEIKQLVKTHNREELEKRLASRIQFGTAGLRGKMEAGFSRMNDVTVIQASQGLACYVLNQIPSSQQMGVVVGHDHRHNSMRFAQLTMIAFQQKGFKVIDLGMVHTPLVAFAVDTRKAACGVMITASHNPKDDNGYKVYWQNGCQIIPPHDVEISKCIEENLEPWSEESWDTTQISQWDENIIERPSQELTKLYFTKMVQTMRDDEIVFGAPNLQRTPPNKIGADDDSLFECDDRFDHSSSRGSTLSIVYTPMHGVGLPYFQEAAAILGFPAAAVVTVDEQAQPDPDFPTVKFPNPEEAGALDLAMKKADERGIDVVLANDPDADRFAVALKSKGQWKKLTGNELGTLFAWYQYTQWSKKNNGKKLAMVNSTVSSKMLSKLAEKYNFHYDETLTGFKWIGNKAINLEQLGYDVPFGYEEALGYMFSVAHDKDGICAAFVFLQMLLEYKVKGISILGQLEALYKEVGYFAEHNSYYISPSPQITDDVFNYIRRESESDGHHPTTLGEFVVAAWRDLTVGYDSTTENHIPTLPVDASSQMISVLVYDMSSEDYRSIRFTARGSGTEPKLKVYIESCAESMPQAQRLAERMWDLLREKWFVPEVTGLREA